jgi:hypothetical protein
VVVSPKSLQHFGIIISGWIVGLRSCDNAECYLLSPQSSGSMGNRNKYLERCKQQGVLYASSPYSLTPEMETVSLVESSVNFDGRTRSCIPENSTLMR